MRVASRLGLRLVLAAVLTLSLASSAGAQVEGVGYRLAPAATYVVFESDAALTDGFLYGGGAGLSFGEFLELNGAYQFGEGFETDYSELSGTELDPVLQAALAALDAREVGVERYGGDLKLNLSTGAIVPFIRGGAGVVRFSPDGSDASRSLYLLGGAGLQFAAADRYTLTLGAEAFAYRYNPGTTFFSTDELNAVGLGLEDFNQTQVVNPAAHATLQLYLGGRRPGSLTDLDRELQRQFSGGLAGLSLVAEPFYSRVDFDPALNYSDQTFVGGEVGFDVGPLVGLRGFYGRGTPSGDPTDFQDIQMVGGDLRLRLTSGDGLVPFLSVGAGLVDVLDGYAETADDSGEGINRALAEDRPFATGGAGIEIPFGSRVRAIGEVRALLMSAQDEGDVSQPDDVFLNPTYRAGIAIGLGGEAGRPVAAVRQRELDAVEAERARLADELEAQQIAAEAREAELQRAIDAARSAGDSAAVARLELQQIDARLDAAADTTGRVAGVEEEVEIDSTGAPLTDADVRAPVGADGVARALPTPVRTARGERIVTIPLPETGELYVRYGDPSGAPTGTVYGTEGEVVATTPEPAQATEADLREAVREALREALGDQALSGDALTEADLAAIERSVEDRIADRIGDRLRTSDTGITAADLAALESRLEQRLALAVREARVQQAAPPIVIREGEVATPVAPTPAPPSAPAVVDETLSPTVVEARRRGLSSISPLIGLGFGRTENVLVGLRARYATSDLTYLPELAVSAAGRRMVSASLDAAFDFPAGSLARYGSPYARVGVGVINVGADEDLPPTFEEEADDGGTAATLNLGLGANLDVVGGRLFVDFTTGNFGRYNRFTAGYRFPFGLRTD